LRIVRTRQVKDRKIIGERVQPGVIAERPFAPALARLNVAFEHDLRVGRHFEIDGPALHQLDAALAEDAGEHQLVEPFRHRRGGRVLQHRIGAQRDRNVEPLAKALATR
jgi:hypothetical protein